MTKRADVELLTETGMLFEVNRNVLHPYGYSLAYEEGSLVLYDYTDEPGGVAFTEAEMNDGIERLARFFKEKKVVNRIGDRIRMLGAVVQGVKSAQPQRGKKKDP